MSIPVFLSYPKPCFGRQKEFVEHIRSYLSQRGLRCTCATLGVTDYDMNTPLTAVRNQMMLESNGLLTIAFRHTYVERDCSTPHGRRGAH